MSLQSIAQAIVDGGLARRFIVFSHLHVGSGPPASRCCHCLLVDPSEDKVPVLGAQLRVLDGLEQACRGPPQQGAA